MTGNDPNAECEEKLTLQSRISELARIPPWIEHLAAVFSIPVQSQFAMNLCLEEALSNIMRHGYASVPGHIISIVYSMPGPGVFQFVLADEAPHFNPVEAVLPPVPSSLDDLPVGGQGIRLMRQFADSLQYEAMPNGNRLCLIFIASPGAEQKTPLA